MAAAPLNDGPPVINDFAYQTNPSFLPCPRIHAVDVGNQNQYANILPIFANSFVTPFTVTRLAPCDSDVKPYCQWEVFIDILPEQLCQRNAKYMKKYLNCITPRNASIIGFMKQPNTLNGYIVRYAMACSHTKLNFKKLQSSNT